ncbi:hypothetical protein U1Q18_040860 [Sarracenia purpurea var. burkii]
MSRREYELQMADEEARQLRSFQAAIAAQPAIIHELKETPPAPKVQEGKVTGRKKPLAHALGMNIIIKPQTKKAKIDMADADEALDSVKSTHVHTEKSSVNLLKTPKGDVDQSHIVGNTCLVSYSDESEDD